MMTGISCIRFEEGRIMEYEKERSKGKLTTKKKERIMEYEKKKNNEI